MRRGIAFALIFLVTACGGDQGIPESPSPVRVSGCRHVTVLDELGNAVVGIEDIAVDHMRGLVYLSAYDRRGARGIGAQAADAFTGGIFVTELKAIGAANRRISGHNILPLSAKEALPHGLELLIEPDGQRWLFAIDRKWSATKGSPRILMLALSEDGLSAREDIPPRAAPKLCNPNNIAAIDHDQLYVSSDRRACSAVGRWIENALGLQRSFVAFLNNGTFRKTLSGLYFANGLEIDELDTGQHDLAVAETRLGEVKFYPILNRNTGELGPLRARIRIGEGPDNLAEGSDGAIYVAAIPSLLRYAIWKSFGAILGRPRGSIYRIWRETDDKTRRWAHILDLDPDILPGPTIAIQSGRHLLMGSAFGEGIAACIITVASGGEGVT